MFVLALFTSLVFTVGGIMTQTAISLLYSSRDYMTQMPSCERLHLNAFRTLRIMLMKRQDNLLQAMA